MRTAFFATLAAAGFALAAPLNKRNNDGKGAAPADGSSGAPASPAASADIDPIVLNFALTLEHLEAAFYKQGIEKYSAEAFASASYPEWVRFRMSEIGSHEATHVEFLSGALTAAGATPVKACEYSFPDNSPESFVAVAQILEGVGVSAYTGAAQLITSPAYLTAAAQILAVEARHSAWIRGGAQNGDSMPAAFDLPLGVNQTYSLAAPFITSCPSDNPPLPVAPFPALTATPINDQRQVTLSYANQTEGNFAVFVTPTGQSVVSLPADGTITVPEDVPAGQNYVVVTNSNATLADGITVAGPAIVEIDLPATLYEL